MALVANSNSPLLVRICELLYDLNIRYRYIACKSNGYKARKVDDEHQAILDAVIAEDADAAVALLMSHYEKTGDFLKTYIK